MSLNSHHKRIITGLALLPALLLAVFGGPATVLVALILVSALGLWEFYGLFWPGSSGVGKKLMGLGLALLFLLTASLGSRQLLLAVLILSFWAGNFFFLFCYSRRPADTTYTNTAVLLGGLFYLPLSLHFFLFMRPAEILFVLLMTTASDVGAFYAGSTFGRRRIWPSISPKKTWEGSVGGVILCVCAALVYGLWFGAAPWWVWPFVAVLLNVASQMGDFFESALKRWLNVKDSGTLLPGHGGILDRIDSTLLVVPVYAALRAIHPMF